MATHSHAPSDAGRSGDHSDVFLAVTTTKSGKLKGECTTAGHVGDISVHGWSWGVSQRTDSASGLAQGKRAYKNLVVLKDIDLTSTKLMNAAASNEQVVEAKLSMRKAGGDALGYFTMTLNNARITALDIEVGHDGRPVERVSLAFSKIEIEYVPQGGDGSGGGSTSFTDEWSTPA